MFAGSARNLVSCRSPTVSNVSPIAQISDPDHADDAETPLVQYGHLHGQRHEPHDHALWEVHRRDRLAEPRLAAAEQRPVARIVLAAAVADADVRREAQTPQHGHRDDDASAECRRRR
ncbi:MAG: hypothetical protein WKF58_15040 [Ilumatobacteraceae bacterium]